MSNTKRNALFLLFVFGLLTSVLAMSLPTLVLGAGKPFSFGQPQAMLFGTLSSFPRSELPVLIIRGILALALIFFPFSLIYALMTPDGRRRLLMYAVLIVIILLAANYLRDQNQAVQQVEQTLAIGTVQNMLAGEATPPPVFTPTPPAGLTAAIALAIAIIATVLIVGGVLVVRRRTQLPATPLQRLAAEVQNAIEALHAGNDLTTTIAHCYQEMSRVVQEEKGLTRQITMTPHEFEDQLIGIGLPQMPIKTLTGLFERVRYGNSPMGAQEETLALACLTDIVNACRPKGLA